MVLMVLTFLLAVLGLWLLLTMGGVILLSGPESAPAPPATVDPYQAQVEEFRAALGDWDRRGRP